MNKSHADTIFSKRFLREIISVQHLRGYRIRNRDRAFADGPSLHTLFIHRNRAGAKLAAELKKRTYEFSPAIARPAQIGGKSRVLYKQIPADVIVISALAKILGPMVKPHLSETLYSYQKGRGSLTAISALQRYLRYHVKSNPSPLTRGLYVLQRDVTSYGDTIPTDEHSPLWEVLLNLMNENGVRTWDHPFAYYLRQAICRRVVTLEGEETRLSLGVPTGFPIQPMINNLYLGSLDKKLSSTEGAFYARYGDDFIFAHPSQNVARAVSVWIDKEMERLRLSIGSSKKKNIYFTGAGRSADEWPDAAGNSAIEYLGCRIEFMGTVSLKKKKVSDLIGNLRRRMQMTARVLQGESDCELGKALAAVVNAALDTSSLLAERNAQLLRHVVNDRNQLKHLDYLIAKELAGVLARTRSPRAFRYFPYRMIREDFGLHSLVTQRNRVGKR